VDGQLSDKIGLKTTPEYGVMHMPKHVGVILKAEDNL
jgi:hypothetical protein